MQTNAPRVSFPTTAQVHQGQLEDFELLVTVLRAYSGSLDDFSQMLLKPSTFSPLDQEHETGQGALQQLLEDPDYRALCAYNNVSPDYLTVTMKEGAFVYETSNQDGVNKTELDLTGNEKWQALRTLIEQSVPLLGGQIRYDRLISASRIAIFYGMIPWDPTQPAEHQAAIDALREKIASYQLGLEEDFNLLDLKADLTNKLRQVSIKGILADSQEEMQRQFITNEVKRVIQTFLPEGVTSPLTYLANDVLVSAEPERVRAQPTVFLKKILQSVEARKLGDCLLSMLNWYGGKPGEETAPHIRVKVVANALRIWFHSRLVEYPDRIAGYDLQSLSNWGKSYNSIWKEFENHLLISNRASSEKEATVLAKLFLCQFPAEFCITDIPSELSYRGSVVWVNFMTGVTLVHSASPKALYRQNFQKLVNLPLKLSEGAPEEHLHAVSLARLLPAVDWAVTQGVIPQKPYEEYTQAETERALSELDKHTAALNAAITQINEEPPKRLSIAEAEIKKLFKECDLLSKGRKLASKKPSVGARPASGYLKYSIVDILASDRFGVKQKWWVTEGDGITRTDRWIMIDKNRSIRTEGLWVISSLNGRKTVLSPYAEMPDVRALFDTDFKRHLESITAAYETLIRTLLASLPLTDRQALEFGEVQVYSLRGQTQYTYAHEETAEQILALRTRNGLILQATHRGTSLYYELLPKAGVIRRLDYFNSAMIGGVVHPKGRRLDGTELYMLAAKELPFDWDAHSTGSPPRKNAHCGAIVEMLGSAFAAVPETTQHSQTTPLTLSSSRSVDISHHIATELLYVDPTALRSYAFGQTEIDRQRAQFEKVVKIFTSFVPFWGSIDDLLSGDRSRQKWGAIGIFFDILSFAIPMGKFAAGSVRLINTAGQIGTGAALPAFSSLTRKLLISTLRAANPLDVIPSLLRGLGNGLRGIGNFAINTAKLTGTGQPYKYVRSLAQLSDVSNWKPLAVGDQLASVKGIDNVSMRNIAAVGNPDYRLLDPLTSKPYGPALSTNSGEISLGRSHYSILENNNGHAIVEVSENTRIRELPEVDGRTTVYLDDVAYRLDGDIFRRVHLIDDSEALKLVPCRPRRAPGETVCINSYVSATPAPAPSIGLVDESKGYALWFGDRLSTPETWRQHQYLTLDGAVYRVTDNVARRFHGNLKSLGFAHSRLVPRQNITATIEFRKGIYARINALGTYEGAQDIHRVGAIVVPAIDDKAVHVFTRVNTDQYYLATVPKDNSLSQPLVFKRLKSTEMADGTLGEELVRVYTGSLHANNTARIHGIEAVDRALKTMEDIAIPLGTTGTPASNMKWVKVDTSPGEALMFDHSTRMIVTRLPEGAAAWTRSKEAPQAFRQKTAEIFDTLFLSPTISPRNADAALQIELAMGKLQRLLPRNVQRANPRNIAFAEVMTTSGHREIYVSVSGAQGSTTRLPLFRHLGANHVRIGDTTYINIDFNQAFPITNLKVTPEGKILAIPITIKDINTYKPRQMTKPTSLDSESKLINVIREKYPDPSEIRSVDIATTMRPCESCSVVMKQFGHDGAEDSLQVLWN
ncbi:hypothetical protein PMA3_06925 [Pseudomonas silesiensis]|uniref:Deaminase n=1 Tax=Pseudomonas silesiensis TaxID=1853130 RepID=A0A191YQ74_9PSED|nr:deaminase domain-containing protein [Pseudomonas silesiensis]ANJ54909.1 hypothetical protein PMA3_06925 [Pseudomonas silesiensis]